MSSARPIIRLPRSAVLLTSSGLGLLLATPAMAQCQFDGPGSVTCTGANTSGLSVFTGSDVTATTEPGFSVVTDDDEIALNIQGNGSVTYIDTNASIVRNIGGRGLVLVGGINGTGKLTVTSNGEMTGSLVGAQFNSRGVGGMDITLTGPVTGGTGFGIAALNVALVNDPAIPNDVILRVGDATGTYGIVAENRGANGSIRITSTGTATGTAVGGNGISAFISVPGVGHDVLIDANNVNAVTNGIVVANLGNGTTTVLLRGTITAQEGTGISAQNGTNGTDVAVTAEGSITSGRLGIGALNTGTGSTTVIANGKITTLNFNPVTVDGIPSGNGITATALGTSVTVQASEIDSGRNGIFVRSRGNGATNIAATGLITARDGNGIDITTGENTTGTTINVASIDASQIGILGLFAEPGDITITATGQVTGQLTGIDARRLFGSGDLTVQVASVTGGETGVIVGGGTNGATQFTSTGSIVGGTLDGLFVRGGGSSVTVNAVDTRGGGSALFARNFGFGETRVTSTGSAIGGDLGVNLVTEVNSTSIIADINNASGGNFGIQAVTRGSGGLELVTRGAVEGGTAGIDVIATNGEAFSITNSGTIRNSSGLSSDLAIQSTGGAGTIANSGTLLGTVSLGVFDGGDDDDNNQPTRNTRGDGGISALAVVNGHNLVNTGDWNSIGGTSEFLGAADVLLNQQGGRLVGGVNAALAETTTYSGLEQLNNSGTISMRDGGIGDIIRTSGDAFFGAGSILAVDAGGAGSDRFVADGATEIAPGALLQVANPQAPVLGTRYTILESAGGVIGQFTFTNQLISNFIGYRLGATATTVFVELAQLRSFASAGDSFNQRSVGAALDSLPVTDPLAAAILVLPSDAAAQNAFDALSGELHPGVRTTFIEDSRLPRNAVLSRLDDREGSAIWGQAMGSWGQSDGGNGRGALKRDGYGALLGADVGLGDTFTIGIAGAYLERDLDLPSRASTGTLRSAHVIGYVGASFGGFRLKAGGGYAAASVDTVRGVAFPGIAQTLVADYDGTMIQGFAEAGYRIPQGGGHVEPFAQVATIRAETEGFAETGGSAALTAGKERDTATISTAGVRFETSQAGAFSVGGMAGWQHSFGTLNPATDFRFSAGSGFAVLGAPRSRDGAVATIDARFRLSPGVTVAVSYDGVLGSSSADHSVTGGLRIAF